MIINVSAALIAINQAAPPQSSRTPKTPMAPQSEEQFDAAPAQQCSEILRDFELYRELRCSTVAFLSANSSAMMPILIGFHQRIAAQ
jgi:hypothetical protein